MSFLLTRATQSDMRITTGPMRGFLPSNLRFAHTFGRFWESTGNLFIQVGWQAPEFEESLLHFGQGREQDVNMAVNLHHAGPDGLQGPQQQLGAGACGAASGLSGREVLQR